MATQILEKPAEEAKRFIAGADYDRLVQSAEEVGQALAGDDLTKSQIRNIYGMVKQMQAEGFNDRNAQKLKLLVPKIKYVAAKEGRGLPKLEKVLTAAIGEVKNDDHFQRFADFFEAIVAYHYVEQESRKRRRNR
jgi:CRISPR-associated protein Csm2